MVKAISACPLLSNNCFKNFIALIVITFLFYHSLPEFLSFKTTDLLKLIILCGYSVHYVVLPASLASITRC